MDAIGQVREGMDVVSGSGEKLGTIESFKMGDPEASTAQGQTTGEHSGPIEEFLTNAFDPGPDVPKEQSERLLRVGYIRVDGKGLNRDSYYAADEIARVEDDTVYLTS